jgi:hypothetical protein
MNKRYGWEEESGGGDGQEWVWAFWKLKRRVNFMRVN